MHVEVNTHVACSLGSAGSCELVGRALQPPLQLGVSPAPGELGAGVRVDSCTCLLAHSLWTRPGKGEGPAHRGRGCGNCPEGRCSGLLTHRLFRAQTSSFIWGGFMS